MKTVKTQLAAPTAAAGKVSPRRKAPPAKARRTPTGGPVKLLSALAALAWLRANPRGSVGEERAHELKAIVDGAEKDVDDSAKTEWREISAILGEGASVKRSAVTARTTAWFQADGAATAKSLHDRMKRARALENKENKENLLKSIVIVFSPKASAKQRKSAAASLESLSGEATKDVARLWSTGTFAQPGDDPKDAPVSARTGRQARGTSRKTPKDDDASREDSKIAKLLELEQEWSGKLLTSAGKWKANKENTLEGRKLKRIKNDLRKAAQKHAEEKVIAKASKSDMGNPAKLTSAADINKESMRLFKRPLVHPRLVKKLLFAMCEHPAKNEETLCVYDAKGGLATPNASWGLVSPARKIEFAKSKKTSTIFLSKSGFEKGAGSRVQLYGYVKAKELEKYARVDVLMTNMEKAVSRWRRDLHARERRSECHGVRMRAPVPDRIQGGRSGKEGFRPAIRQRRRGHAARDPSGGARQGCAESGHSRGWRTGNGSDQGVVREESAQELPHRIHAENAASLRLLLEPGLVQGGGQESGARGRGFHRVEGRRDGERERNICSSTRWACLSAPTAFPATSRAYPAADSRTTSAG